MDIGFNYTVPAPSFYLFIFKFNYAIAMLELEKMP